MSELEFWTDNVANDLFGDWNSLEAVHNAANYCDEFREKCLQENQSIIFETVLSSFGKVDFIKRAIEKDYFFSRFFFVCTNSPTINAGRIAHRVLEGGHDVPISKNISRFNKSILNGMIVSKNVDRCYFYDNSLENKEPKLLFTAKNGKISKEYRKIAPWAELILEKLKV